MLKPTVELQIDGKHVGEVILARVTRDMDMAAYGLAARVVHADTIALGAQMSLRFADADTDLITINGAVSAWRPDIHGAWVEGLGGLRLLAVLCLASSYDGQTTEAIVRDLADEAGSPWARLMMAQRCLAL